MSKGTILGFLKMLRQQWRVKIAGEMVKPLYWRKKHKLHTLP